MDNIKQELDLVSKIYSLSEIKSKITGIMRKYNIEKAYLFGSYAKGEANLDSDIDIMIKIKDSDESFGLIKLSALENELMKELRKEIDIIIEGTYTKEIKYDSKNIKVAKELFYKNIKNDMIKIYG